MGRYIIVVLDGFGIGYMDDAALVRPDDVGANTLKSIVKAFPDLHLPTLEALGLMNAAGFETAAMHKNPAATYGVAKLNHYGADTFWGHQEIMGTRPRKPAEEPLAPYLDEVRAALQQAGYRVQVLEENGARLLLVNGAVTVADNIECDPGLAVNVTAAIDDIPFDEVRKIGKIVREHVTASRVIAFGGSEVHIGNILNAIEIKDDGYIGVNAPGSGVYNKNYHCVHMGYGVDPDTQLPNLLQKAGIPCYLLGKAADIIYNPVPENSFSIVPTPEVLDKTCKIAAAHKTCFICANVQETDLSGHRENPAAYRDVLEQADAGLARLEQVLEAGDLLVVMADHGNDPLIGHPHHTRERVPLLVYGKGEVLPGNLGERDTLSDVSATAAAYFHVPPPENGTSFLPLIQPEAGSKTT